MKEKTYTFKTMVPVIGMLLSFLGVCFFTSLYMAKDNNYDNIIYQYFHISKQLHFRMMYLDISKFQIISGMNLCSVLFIVCNYFFSWAIYEYYKDRVHKTITILLIVFWSVEIILYNPYVYCFIYYGRAGFLPNPVIIEDFYDIYHQFTIHGNIFCIFYSFYKIIVSYFSKEPLRFLRRIKGSMVLIETGICVMYIYMFFNLPNHLLHVSRVADYVTYYSLKLGNYTSLMKVIPYLIIVFLFILIISLYEYEKTNKKILNNEHVLSNMVASAEISTRALSHYVKNEILSIESEADWIMKKPDITETSLQRIKETCRNMYERMDTLQKKSNRIVLNQRLSNLNDVIRQSIEKAAPALNENNIICDFKETNKSIYVFIDRNYMGEVFQNIFLNSIEAMETNSQSDRKIIISIEEHDKRVRIKIRDYGPGINEAVAERLFEPFVSTKSTKTNWGIGLSFSKRIVNSHMGKIEATNAPDGGAVIQIWLPIISKERHG